MSAHFTIINIGRNIGTEPMSQDRWNMFVWETRRVASNFGIIGGSANGRSRWEGIPEEFYSVHLLIPDITSIPPIRLALRDLAERYEQEAIAFIVSDHHDLVLTAR